MKSTIRTKKTVALFVAMLLTAVMVLPTLAACGNKGSKGEATYTYNEYISQSPSTWNTHNGTTDADTYIQGYTEIGLYDFTLSEDRSTYAFIDEMATGDPVNVTGSYVGKYGIVQGDADNTALGKAWEITLNPDATWENGTKITAEDYVWSMERVLSSEMKNSAAAKYITGDYEIYNANNYYNAGAEGHYQIIPEKLTDAQVSERIAEKTLYFSLTKGTPIMGSLSLQAYHDLGTGRNARFFRKGLSEDPNVRDWYAYLSETYGSTANEYGYILVTESNLADIKEGMSILSENLESLSPGSLSDWTLTLSEQSTTYPSFDLIPIDVTYEETQLQEMMAQGTLYFSLTEGDIIGTNSLKEYHDKYDGNARFFRENMSENPEDRDWYAYLSETYGSTANEYGYIKVTEENYDDIKTGMSILSANLESLSAGTLPNWYNTASILTYKEYTSVPFNEVGIFATNENAKFVIVFANALSQWDVKYLLTDNWIVYKPYYEAGYSQQGSLKVTNYGTSSGQYMGYGPYKLAGYQANSQISFVRNENWYGYKEGATNYHAGQFQTDKIVCRIISDQNTALLAFESGSLDTVRLNANNMDQYRFSDYLLTRSASNNWSITFNSDATTLAKIESDNQGNRRVLSIEDFRRGISLSIDRAYIGANILAGSASAYSFINDNYYYDMENDPESIYRNSDQAMQAIVKLYNIEYGEGKTYKTLEEAYKSVSGYDVTAAKAAFESAYAYAIENDLYTDGQTIKINIYNNAVNTQLTALAAYLQTCIGEATKGTDFEGKVKVELKAMQTGRYDQIAQGNIEAVYYSFGGDYADPNGMIANFTDPEVQTILEYGFDPTAEEFTITYDFDGDGTEEEETMSYQEWQQSITASGDYYGAAMDVKLTIMAELEYHLLSGFRTLPLVVGTDLTLRSMKVNYATNNSNIFAMYGGVRLMTYNYNDSEWADFIKNPGNLVYE